MTDIEQVRNLRISDYNYPLPDERIAKHPLTEREQCKLLVFDQQHTCEKHFYDIPQLLPENSLLIYNNTRVINARLRFRKATGSTIEIFCLEPVSPHDYQLIFQTTDTCTWLCLVGNSKRWKEGALTQTVTSMAVRLHLAPHAASAVAIHGKSSSLGTHPKSPLPHCSPHWARFPFHPI